MRSIRLAPLAAFLLSSVSAHAQTAPGTVENIVMRKQIPPVANAPDKPAPTPTPPAPVYTYAWEHGDWGAPSSMCSEEAVQTRDVRCVRSDLQTVEDKLCTDERPEGSQLLKSLSGCTFDWTTTAWSDWTTTCGANASRTRTASCQRSDVTKADDASCSAGSRPTTAESADNYTGCTGVWTTMSTTSTCVAMEATTTKTVSCSRPDGSKDVSEASCNPKIKPTGGTTTVTCNPAYQWRIYTVIQNTTAYQGKNYLVTPNSMSSYRIGAQCYDQNNRTKPDASCISVVGSKPSNNTIHQVPVTFDARTGTVTLNLKDLLKTAGATWIDEANLFYQSGSQQYNVCGGGSLSYSVGGGPSSVQTTCVK